MENGDKDMFRRSHPGTQRTLILVSIYLTLVTCIPLVYASDQSRNGSKDKAQQDDKTKQDIPAKSKAEQDNESDENADKASTGDSNQLANDEAIALVKKYVRVSISVMGPKNVSDAYGRRIAHRYVAIQIVIRNRNTSYDFLLHEVNLDVSRVIKVSELKLPPNKTYGFTSTDLGSLRGVSEKGQAYDPRNLILRILRGAGTIGAGLIGVTTFGASYAPSVAVFNGPVVSAFTEAFPDSTINQLSRLNDDAFSENVLVPKGRAKKMTAFVDLDTIMPKSLQKKFYNDPMSIVNQVDVREVEAIVRGIYVTQVVAEPLLVTRALISDEQMKHFQDDKPVVEGYILGRSLNGATLDLDNQEPKGLTIELKGTPEKNRLDFTINSEKPVKPDTLLQFAIVKNEEVGHTNLAVRYFIDTPTLDTIDPDPAEATQGSSITLNLTGTHFIDGFSEVTISGDGIKITKTDVKDDKSIEVTLSIAANAKPGDRDLKVENGPRLQSKSQTLTIKEKEPESKPKPVTKKKKQAASKARQ